MNAPVGISYARLLRRPVKRELLFFKQLLLVDGHVARTNIIDPRSDQRDWLVREYEWLYDNGLVAHALTEEQYAHLDSELLQQLLWDRLPFSDAIRLHIASQEDFSASDAQFLSDHEIRAGKYLRLYRKGLVTRLVARQVADRYGVRAYPLTYESDLPLSDTGDIEQRRVMVLKIVLAAFPQVSDATPWERILEFRADSNSQRHYLALQDWMSEIARTQLSADEIAERLEYLLLRHRRHMDLHKLEYTMGTVEAVVVTVAEIAEALIKMKLGSIAKTLFSVSRQQIGLLKAEESSPGTRVAYVVRAQDAFQS